MSIDFGDHIALLEPSLFRRGTRNDLGDQCPGRAGFEFELLGQRGVKILNLDTQHAALNLAVLDQLLHDYLGNVAGNGKTDTDISPAPTGSCNGGIDTDHLAGHVDQWPTGITWIDGGIGLNEVVVAAEGTQGRGSACRADDAEGGRALQSQRLADGDHEIAYMHLAGVSNWQLGQVLGMDPDHSQVGIFVYTDHRGLVALFVVKRNGDGLGIADDMVIGQNISLGGIDNNPSPETDKGLLDRLIRGSPEELLKQRVHEWSPYPALDDAGGGDIDYCRHGFFDKGRQAGHAA